MSRDLDEQLNEMGPEYRAVVARLRAAETAEGLRRETRDLRRGFMSQVFGLKSYLTAASLLVILGLGVFFSTPQPLNPSTSQLTYGAHEYQMGIPEMIATQNPDGSWKNDFLTRRNAAALKGSSNPAAQVAYKKAMRYLHAKGLEPMNG